MADVSIIIATNAEQASKEIKGLSNSVLNASDKALKMTKAFDFLDRAFNKGKISASQYQTATSALDASEDALYASIGKTTQAVQQQSAAAQAAAASVDRLADEAEMLSMKYKAGYAAGKQLAASTKELNTALKLGVISAKQHKLQIAELGKEYQRTGKYSKGFSALQRMSGKSTNKFGMYAQQVGYQVGDFAVQVQSGTNALVAFGQQGTQLAGLIPGLAGAILGIGLAIGTAIARSVLESKNLTISFKAVKKSFADALTPMKPLIDAVGSAFVSVGDTVVKWGKMVGNNISRVLSYTIALAILLAGKMVYGFIKSGKAAGAFFRLFKAGLISTGVGIFVIALGEIILKMQNMIVNAGSLAEAWGAIKDIFKALWEFAGSKIDVYVAKLKTVGPMMKAFLFSTVSSILTSVESLINKSIRGLNGMLSTANLPDLGEVNLTGGFSASVTEAQIALSAAEDSVSQLEETASGAMDGLIASVNTVLDLAKGASSSLDTSTWLVPDTDDDKGGSGSSSEDPIKKLKAEIALNTKLLTMSKEKAAVLIRVIAIQKTLADQGKTFDEDKLIALVKQNEELKKQKAISQGLTDFIGSSMETAMMGIVDGTLSVKDAFKSMARDIIKELYRVLVVQEMVANAKEAIDNRGGIVKMIFGGFGATEANGGAWQGGSKIQAYANGGVVGGPTTFPMSGGQTGLMGEAGPEAIMPLKRGSNGKLGVQMEGGRSGDVININQSFNFQANGDDTVKKLIAQAAPKIAQMTKSSLLDDRRRGGSTKAAFG